MDFSQEEITPRVKIIGIGGAGVHVLDQMLLDDSSMSDLAVIDTDCQTYNGTVIVDRLLAGRRTLRGFGCCGDVDLARSLFQDEVEEVQKLVKNAQVVVLIAGLGGGTGTAMTVGLTEVLRDMGITSVVLGITPLKVEGKRKFSQAQAAASVLRSKADAFFLFSNERLMEVVDQYEDPRMVFQEMNRLLGGTCRSLVQLLSRRGLVDLNLADIQALLGCSSALNDELENCWVGIGSASGEDCERYAVEEALSSPMFLDEVAWKAGDRILACIEGGADMSVVTYQAVMEHLKQELPVELPIVAGATIHSNTSDYLRLTLFVARSGESLVATEEVSAWKEMGDDGVSPRSMRDASQSVQKQTSPAIDFDDGIQTVRNIKPAARPQKYFTEQVELPLQNQTFRGRFEKSNPTIMDGEDLDQPTFMRVGLKIRL